MRRYIKFTLFLLYRYYSDSKWGDIAYFSSILIFLSLLYLNFLTFLVFINVDLSILPWWVPSDSKGWKYAKFLFLFILPSYFIVKLFISEDDIKNSNYSEHKIHLGNIILIIYAVTSFILFICAVILM